MDVADGLSLTAQRGTVTIWECKHLTKIRYIGVKIIASGVDFQNKGRGRWRGPLYEERKPGKIEASMDHIHLFHVNYREKKTTIDEEI